MLIGSSDSATADAGKLRVTIHHNVFANVGQRAPRVRFGLNHVYNNYYLIGNPANYAYTWGVGVQSQIYAQNNFFATVSDITPDQFIANLGGMMIHAEGTYVNLTKDQYRVDAVAAHNAVNEPDLSPVVNWIPTLVGERHPIASVPGLVWKTAGPFEW